MSKLAILAARRHFQGAGVPDPATRDDRDWYRTNAGPGDPGGRACPGGGRPTLTRTLLKYELGGDDAADGPFELVPVDANDAAMGNTIIIDQAERLPTTTLTTTLPAPNCRSWTTRDSQWNQENLPADRDGQGRYRRGPGNDATWLG